MDQERINELKTRPFAKIFPQSIKDIENNICPTCKQPIGAFRDDLSRKEYTISGICQKCQDGVFNNSDNEDEDDDIDYADYNSEEYRDYDDKDD